MSPSRSLFVCLLLLAFSACKKENADIVIDPCGIDFQSTFHFAALGSGFIDAPPQSPDSTLAFFVEHSLENENIALEENYGVYSEGATSSELGAYLDSNVPDCVNLILVVSGPQDVLVGTPNSVFRNDFRALIEEAISRVGPAERVFTSEIPDFSKAPAIAPADSTMTRMRIEGYNQIILEEAADHGINVSDVELVDAIYGAGFGHEPASEGGDDLKPNVGLLQAWAGTIALKISSVVD